MIKNQDAKSKESKNESRHSPGRSAEEMRRMREKQKEMREAGEFEILDPIQKAQRNPKSRKLAINAKCYDCEGQDADPNWKYRVGNCTCPECPLYAFRPYQRFYDPNETRCFDGRIEQGDDDESDIGD